MVSFDADTDWDGAVSESGVVHESVANTDHVDAGVVKRGYSVASPTPSVGLAGYWPLQEDTGSTAYDFSGRENHATISGAMQGQPGLLSTTAYSFDGVDDYLSVSSDTAWAGIRDWTIAFWARFEDVPTTYSTSLYNTDDVRNNSGDGGLQVRPDSQRLRAWIDWNSGGGDVFSDATIQPDRWYFITVQSDGRVDEGRLYLDGTLDASASGVAGNLGGSGQALEIGGNNNTDNFHSGSIWDFRLYDRVLSASEIQTLYDVVVAPGTITTAPKEVQ